MRATAASRLLDHYRRSARVLPWRSPPGGARPDPYRVWLSEVMLQQTSVAAVTPRFTRFLDRWPTVAALAAAEDSEILGEWAGLGYYARARNLIACARTLAADGFPTDEAGWRGLPGVGDYTAAAIAAIAFGRRAVVIDTNVERVVARLDAIATPLPAARREIRRAVEAMTPAAPEAGDFAQAMMDLGATICRPRAPLCHSCPISADCRAFALGNPEAFPVKAARPVRPHRHGVARWHEADGRVLLVRRDPRGMLGGMAALPGGEWGSAPDAAQPPIAVIRHHFTHFTLDLAIVRGASEPDGAGWWHPLATIDDAGLPTLYRKAVAAVLAGG